MGPPWRRQIYVDCKGQVPGGLFHRSRSATILGQIETSGFLMLEWPHVSLVKSGGPVKIENSRRIKRKEEPGDSKARLDLFSSPKLGTESFTGRYHRQSRLAECTYVASTVAT